jgi:hypothetical protein
MTCARGKCPCWPRGGPFDAPEMALLATVRDLVSYYFSGSRHVLWAKVVTQSLAVRPQRRGYVLSTTVDGFTALGRMRFDAPSVRWLLNVGVCPNISRCGDAFGWAGGPLHPGRPAQYSLINPLLHGCVDVIEDLLLSAGACPLYRGYNGYNYSAQRPVVTRQWLSWHARASRRAWAAVAVVREETEDPVAKK